MKNEEFSMDCDEGSYMNAFTGPGLQVDSKLYKYDSIDRAVLERMIEERGTYGFEDICRLTAEEICKHKGIVMSKEFFAGFLEASNYEYKKKK